VDAPDVGPICPKCGGRMVPGEIKISGERLSQSMSPFSGGLPTQGLPNIVETIESRSYWEEKTGEKTGFIFKREETRQMKLAGFRCTLCNYIELYTREK
jgi:predicted nucleic-acid-binding Zn-ribbon protein